MNYLLSTIAIFSIALSSCQTGELTVIADINSELKETSAVEIVEGSPYFWVIEDGANGSKVYALNDNGNIEKAITVENAKNRDWEDLTSDSKGNLYIGDFGNNSKKREKFSIYKIENIKDVKSETTATEIEFSLPKNVKSKDFEAFFLLNNHFYIFSKEQKNGVVIKVPNSSGKHEAELVTEFDLKGKNVHVTSADISPSGNEIILLNHNRLWKLSNFKEDAFFKGNVKEIKLNHKSQKEGVAFKSNSSLYIVDERTKSKGGNIYRINL